MTISPAMFIAWHGAVAGANLSLAPIPVVTGTVISGVPADTLQGNLSTTYGEVAPPRFGVWSRTNINQSTSTWIATRDDRFRAALTLLSELSELPANWDGHGGEPISANVVRNARLVLEILSELPPSLPEPEISPKSAGTIAFSWEIGETEAYLEVGNTRFSGYVKPENQEPAYLEGRADELDRRVGALIADALCPPVTVPSTITLVEIGEPAAIRMAA